MSLHPTGFGKELFQGDLERVSGHLEKLMERIPCLERAEVQNVVSGPITYSPDVLPMVGPASTSLRNYWLAAAFRYVTNTLNFNLRTPTFLSY